YFTGSVRIDPLFQAAEPSRVSAGLVTFEPGARTAWLTHPLGQRLIVTSGCGSVLGRPQRGNSARRCDLVSTRSEALAWGDGINGHEPHRRSGGARRQGCRLARKGQRRTIPGRTDTGIREAQPW